MENSNATEGQVIENWHSMESFVIYILKERRSGRDLEKLAAKLFGHYERYNKRLTPIIFEELLSRRPMACARAATKVFELADIEKKGYLDVESFTTACDLILRFVWDKLPKTLLEELVPHSKRPSPLIPHPMQASTVETPHRLNQDLPQFTLFESLVDDLCYEIISFLPRTTLLDICRVSKRCRHIGIPILYQTVKLGSILVKSPYELKSVTKLPPTPSHTMVQQYRFAKQLIQKPEYSRFVRNFIWSNELEHSDKRSYPTFIDDTFFKWHTHELSDMFSLLQNVNYVDIDICGLYTRTLEIISYFPTARVILIRGGMPLPLLHEILHGKNATDLKRLVLNSMFERIEPYEDARDKRRRAHQKPDPARFNYDQHHWDMRVRVSESQTLYFANIMFSLSDDPDNRLHYGYTPEQYALLEDWSRLMRSVEVISQISDHQRVGDRFPNPLSSPLSSDDVLFKDLLLPILARLKEEED